jgi:hypothetical protein
MKNLFSLGEKGRPEIPLATQSVKKLSRNVPEKPSPDETESSPFFDESDIEARFSPRYDTPCQIDKRRRAIAFA